MRYPSPHISPLRRVAAALACGLVVAALAHAATVLLFFVSAGADPLSLPSLNNFFRLSSLLVFVLLTLAAALEAFRRWYVALTVAVLIAGLAAFFGGMLVFATQGTALDSASISYLVGTLLGPNLIFILAVGIVAATAGVALWRALVGPGSGASERRTVFVRLPASNLAEGQVTHIKRMPVDSELADRQWEQYVAEFSSRGWRVVEVPVAEGCADSVFVEDTVVIFGDTAVITRPAVESRQGESDAVETVVRELSLSVAHIREPGTLDGGDVLLVGNTVYVGSSGRTNGEGIRQLRAIVAPLGFTVVGVPVSKAVHLKSVATALPDGTVIGVREAFEQPNLFERFIAVPEALGAAVVVLDGETVLVSAAAPATAQLIETLGYDVVTTEISEFEKLEGGVTCLSVRVP